MNKDDATDYGLADAKAFDQALADNMPYNPPFYAKNKAMLLNFVSYYESCKKDGEIMIAIKNPLTHDKALQSAYQEYGRYIQAGEGSLKAIERAIEVYNYVMGE